MIGGALTLIVGYVLHMSLPMDQRGALYFACFLVVPGLYVCPALDLTSLLRTDRTAVYARSELRLDAGRPCRLLQTGHSHRVSTDV